MCDQYQWSGACHDALDIGGTSDGPGSWPETITGITNTGCTEMTVSVNSLVPPVVTARVCLVSARRPWVV